MYRSIAASISPRRRLSFSARVAFSDGEGLRGRRPRLDRWASRRTGAGLLLRGARYSDCMRAYGDRRRWSSVSLTGSKGLGESRESRRRRLGEDLSESARSRAGIGKEQVSRDDQRHCRSREGALNPERAWWQWRLQRGLDDADSTIRFSVLPADTQDKTLAGSTLRAAADGFADASRGGCVGPLLVIVENSGMMGNAESECYVDLELDPHAVVA